MLACLAGAAITRNLRTLLVALAWIFFVYVAIGSVWVWPWYATWFVALAALLDWRATGRTALILSLLVPVIYPLTPILPLPTLLEQFRAVLAFGPPWSLRPISSATSCTNDGHGDAYKEG
jgi:hypothetical protein